MKTMPNEVKGKKTVKAKRVIAIVGIVILLSLYVMTLIAAIFAKPYANKFFIASIYCSLIIPVLIYGFMVVSKAFGRKEGELSLSELRQIRKELKNTKEESEYETIDDDEN
jgi:uncharacterized membrane protein